MRIMAGLAGLTISLAMGGASASAQTAQQYQAATAALQLCGSAAGALIAECAAIRGSFISNPAGMLGALSGAGATGVANAYGLNNAAANMLANSGLSAAQAAQMNANASTATAMGIAAAGQAYQQCVLANQANWQSCLPLMNGGQPVTLPATQAVAPALSAAQTAALQQAAATAAAAAARAADPLSAPAAGRGAGAASPPAGSNPMSVLGF